MDGYLCKFEYLVIKSRWGCQNRHQNANNNPLKTIPPQESGRNYESFRNGEYIGKYCHCQREAMGKNWFTIYQSFDVMSLIPVLPVTSVNFILLVPHPLPSFHYPPAIRVCITVSLCVQLMKANTDWPKAPVFCLFFLDSLSSAAVCWHESGRCHSFLHL